MWALGLSSVRAETTFSKVKRLSVARDKEVRFDPK